MDVLYQGELLPVLYKYPLTVSEYAKEKGISVYESACLFDNHFKQKLIRFRGLRAFITPKGLRALGVNEKKDEKDANV